MTKAEVLRNRIVIASLFAIPPDDVSSFDASHDLGTVHFFEIPYGEINLTVGLIENPPVEELAEELHNLMERVDSWMEGGQV